MAITARSVGVTPTSTPGRKDDRVQPNVGERESEGIRIALINNKVKKQERANRLKKEERDN